MKPAFRFRLNGIYIPEIRVQRAIVHGEPVGKLQLAVRDDTIGWFAVDDNSDLPDKHLAQFILEYRNETDWSKVAPLLKRIDPLKGWRRTSPMKLLMVLQNVGVIDVAELREKE